MEDHLQRKTRKNLRIILGDTMPRQDALELLGLKKKRGRKPKYCPKCGGTPGMAIDAGDYDCRCGYFDED